MMVTINNNNNSKSNNCNNNSDSLVPVYFNIPSLKIIIKNEKH